MAHGNGGALLGGLLIGGLVVGAAMSADREHDRHYHHHRGRRGPYHHHGYRGPPPNVRRATYCICGAQMVQGRIQQGVAKCNNLNCQQILTGRLCYYCPNGGNVQQHKNGFFYCQKCADQLARGAQVIQAKQVQQQPVARQVQQVQQMPQVQQPKSNKPVVVKQGWMEKKGNWLSTAYKKRWFKLWSNKKMAYLTEPRASYTKGYVDLNKIKKMERKNKREFEVTTAERVWAFQCASDAECTAWFNTIQQVCTNVPVKSKHVQPQPMQPQQSQFQQPVQQQPQMASMAQPQGQVQYVQKQIQQQPMQYVQQPIQGQVQQPQMYPNLAKNAPNGPSAPLQQQQQQQQPQQQNLQPGMDGYDMGDMYGNGNSGNNGNNANTWEDKAPPPAFAPSAPYAPSAPPMEEEEGSGTHQ